MPIESHSRSMFFRGSGQFLGKNEIRNDIYHRIEVLRDHKYLTMLLFSLCKAVFGFRLLFTSNFFSRALFYDKKSSVPGVFAMDNNLQKYTITFCQNNSIIVFFLSEYVEFCSK